MVAFKTMNHFEQSLSDGKDMFEVYLSSVPHKLNTMAIAFGEAFFLEAYLRRLTHLSCQPTLKVFQSLALLYGLWNIADNGRLGDFREGDLL